MLQSGFYSMHMGQVSSLTYTTESSKSTVASKRNNTEFSKEQKQNSASGKLST